jgi:hypothetical protein
MADRVNHALTKVTYALGGLRWSAAGQPESTAENLVHHI